MAESWLSPASAELLGCLSERVEPRLHIEGLNTAERATERWQLHGCFVLIHHHSLEVAMNNVFVVDVFQASCYIIQCVKNEVLQEFRQARTHEVGCLKGNIGAEACTMLEQF